MLEHRYISVYLQDHFAGATGGLELAQRAASSNESTEFGPPLAELAGEIAEDRAELRRIMGRFDVEPDRLKDTVAWAAEKVGRLKSNGQRTGYSPLSRVVEIEGLVSGVSGKLCLWRNLLQVAPHDERLDAGELVTLAERAERQLATLHDLRNRAAVIALAPAAV